MNKIKKISAIMLMLSSLVSVTNSKATGAIYSSYKKNDVIINLLGSIHIGSPEMYPPNKNIYTAMQNADAFVLECDNTDSSAVKQAQKLMFLDNESKLLNILDNDTYELCSASCNTMNVRGYERLKPWALYSILSVKLSLEKSPDSSKNEAVDEYVKNFAIDNGKNIEYLESAIEQYNTLDSLSLVTQIELLKDISKTIIEPDGKPGFDSTIDNWSKWWKNQESEEFAQAYKQDLSTDYALEQHEKLVSKRNKKMAVEINKLASKYKNIFVTVGLLHTVLDNDCVGDELINLGYVPVNN